MTNFEKELKLWLEKNHINCGLFFDDEFGYNIDTNNIHVGMIAHEDASRWFEQFLYEYGMEYVGMYDPVLCLLHEVGHYMTIHNFNESQLCIYSFFKKLAGDGMSRQNGAYSYWEFPDEFAANMWVVDFVNEHIDEVEQLCTIYYNFWDKFMEEIKQYGT